MSRQKNNHYETKAQNKLNNYKPNIFNKLFKTTESKRLKLIKRVSKARERDEGVHREAMNDYEKAYTEWSANQLLAQGVLSGDKKSCMEVIEKKGGFSDLSVGTYVNFNYDGPVMDVTLSANADDVIPSEIKSLRESGKLSIKKDAPL